MSLTSVNNKVALITGGASGIGLACAEEFLTQGIKGVAIVDIHVKTGGESSNILKRKHGEEKVVFIRCDVRNKTEFEEAFKATVNKFGQLDIVMNNAGILDELDWETMLDVNLKGTMHGCQLAMETYLPKYKSTSEALIINTSSIVAVSIFDEVPSYTTCKYAILGLTRVLGTQFHYSRTGVRVVAFCPGLTQTPIFEKAKVVHEGKWKESVDAAHSQTSDELARFIPKIIESGANGSIWCVNGNKMYKIEYPNFDVTY